MAKLLVVDDEVDVCSELAELLEDDKHVVDCAENAKQGIDKIKSTHYDVIFLDVLMPKVEGTEALLQVKKISKVPVVIISAYLGEDIEKQALASGAMACLSKPFKIKEIKDIIQQATATQAN